LGWFALANSRYASGDAQGAETALRKSLAQQPDFAAGWFNLSQVLADRGCLQAAEQARACAQRLAPDDQRFATSVKHTAGGPVQQCLSPPVCPRRL
jgi:cytochrome c-type biogenesis protein CcmH/NrfG